MREFRCPHPHPTRLGQVCNRVVAKGELRDRIPGEIQVQCHRCGGFVVLDSRDAYTAAQVDNALVAV
jgi:hypothetical protein